MNPISGIPTTVPRRSGWLAPFRTLFCLPLLIGHLASAASSPDNPENSSQTVDAILAHGVATGHSDEGAPYELSFEATLAETRDWLLKLTYTKLPGKGPIYMEYASDGKDLYQMTSWPPSYMDAGNADSDVGRVSRGEVPGDAMLVDYLPWFAFCSGDYLRRRDDGMMKNIFYWMMRTNSLRFEAQFHPADPQLPKHVKLFKPGEFQPRRTPRVGEKPLSIRLPKPFHEGHVWLEYLTLSTTNFAGRILPARFGLKLWELENSDSGPTLSHSMPYQGRLTSAEPVKVTLPLRPALTSRTVIVDRRQDAVFLKYHTNQASWLNRSDFAQDATIQPLRP